MQIETLLLILLAAIASLAVVWFQYFYKVKHKGRPYVSLAVLRFLAFFSLFLLLINPKFTKYELHLEKTHLILLVDNSSSIAAQQGDDQIASVTEKMIENKALSEKFEIKRYSFGANLNDSSTTSFTEKSTNIKKALTGINTVYGKSKKVIVLLTDGNQTIGEDYEFSVKEEKSNIYAVAIGDTTRYQDLRVDYVNSNTYAFLKNKYPIEIFTSYEGEGAVTSTLAIAVDGKTVFQEKLSYSKTNNSKVTNVFLDASTVGIKNINVSLTPFNQEKNVFNNQKQLSVEVIDEQTTIGIISDIVHPDIGALKKAIESNEQRSVSLHKPGTDIKALENVDVFILYQPNPSFKPIYNYIRQKRVNTFTIAGSETDWNFLNSAQNNYSKASFNQVEDITPVLNPSFANFDISSFSVTNFPPLDGNLGEIIIAAQHEVIFTQRINGIELKDPLFVTMGQDLEREAVLFGDNIWKWRMQSFRNDQDFKAFDDFIGKLILYLSTNTAKNKFNLDYKSVYQGSNEAKITATYFDETFVFDANATIILKLTLRESGVVKEVPMLLKGAYYEADLSDLSAGVYDFVATVTDSNLSKSGSFVVQDFDVEKQFLSTDYAKLNRLARATNGGLYFPQDTEDLLQELNEDKRFLPIQKSKQNVVSLIDFWVLLAVIISALGLEWFIRKYNGLI